MRWILHCGIPPVPHSVHYVRRVPLPASNHNNNSIYCRVMISLSFYRIPFLYYRRRTLEPALKTNSFCDAPVEARARVVQDVGVVPFLAVALSSPPDDCVRTLLRRTPTKDSLKNNRRFGRPRQTFYRVRRERSTRSVDRRNATGFSQSF